MLATQPDPIAAIIKLPDAHAWAAGCDECQHGIRRPAPALRHDRPLYQDRLTQWRSGELHLCDCAAGLILADWFLRIDDEQRQLDADNAALPARLAEQRNDRIFASAGIPAKYAAYTLAGFERLAANDPGKRDAIAALRHYQQHGHALQNGEERPGLMLWGPSGAGKTGSLSPLFTELVRNGASGLWLQYNQLMADMRRFEDGQVDARMEACQSVRYLLLDDLGDPSAQKAATDYARDVLFRIVDYRTSRNMPIFVTTNLAPDMLINQFDQRTARRLLGACAIYHMGGKTLR
jgi:DNA replication protein DnaC